MNGLPDQVMSRVLDDKDKGEALFLDWVVKTFSPNQSSA